MSAATSGVSRVAQANPDVAVLIRATGTSPRCARLYQLVEYRIHQRLERGVDDVGRDADRGPSLALLVLALDQHPRDRLGAAIEDTDAIVDQLQAIDEAL